MVTLNKRFSEAVHYTDNGLYIVSKLLFRNDHTVVCFLLPVTLYPEGTHCLANPGPFVCDISWLDFHFSYELYKTNTIDQKVTRVGARQ